MVRDKVLNPMGTDNKKGHKGSNGARSAAILEKSSSGDTGQPSGNGGVPRAPLLPGKNDWQAVATKYGKRKGIGTMREGPVAPKVTQSVIPTTNRVQALTEPNEDSSEMSSWERAAQRAHLCKRKLRATPVGGWASNQFAKQKGKTQLYQRVEIGDQLREMGAGPTH